MAGLAAAILVLYLALKGVQWVMGPRGSYVDAPPGMGAKMRRGEPWLLFGAVLLPALVYAYSHWWVHRWATRGFAHATDCIGQLTALERLPNVYRRFRRQSIADSALSYYSLAHDQGGQLKLGFEEINGVINRRHAAYAAIYARLARADARQAINERFGSIDRCLKDEWPHDGLLNP